MIKESMLECMHECSRELALEMLPTLKPALEAAVLCAMEDAARDGGFIGRSSLYGAPPPRPRSPPRDEAREGVGKADTGAVENADNGRPAEVEVPGDNLAEPTRDNRLLTKPADGAVADGGGGDDGTPRASKGGNQGGSRRERDQFLAKFAHTEIFGQKAGAATSPVGHYKHRMAGKGVILEGRNTKHMSLNERTVLDPNSPHRFTWDASCMVLILFIAFELPIRLAFSFDYDTPPGWLIYDYCVLLVFFIDMMLNFRTGYVLEGEVIMNPRKIVWHYLRGWFFIDVLSTVPWDVIFCSATECGEEAIRASAALTALRIFKLLRLLRLLRVTRIFKYLEQWEGTALLLTSNAMRIIKLISTMIVFTHWDGCIHFLIAKLESDGSTLQPDSWVVRSGASLHEPGTQYLFSLFNAFSQMLCIGYGLIEPVRLSEVIMTLLSMILGATLYGLFIASLTSFLADSDASAKAYSSQLDMLNQYMKHRLLPPNLRIKMRNYLELSFPNKRAFNEELIMNSLNLPLRKEVAWHKCKVVLSRLPLYDSYSSSTETSGMMTALALALQRQVFVAGDYILREGEHGSDMYFVASGEVAVVTGPPGRHTEVTRLREGAFFGEMALLENSERHLASVLVISFCDAFWMTRQRYQRLVRDYPSVREYLESIARLRLAASLERGSVGAMASPEANELRTADLQTLVSKAKSAGSAMAPIHQGLKGGKGGRSPQPASTKKVGRRRSVIDMIGGTLRGGGGGGGGGGVATSASPCAPVLEEESSPSFTAKRRGSVKPKRRASRSNAEWTSQDTEYAGSAVLPYLHRSPPCPPFLSILSHPVSPLVFSPYRPRFFPLAGTPCSRARPRRAFSMAAPTGTQSGCESQSRCDRPRA